MSIHWSDKAKTALAYLFSPLQDIDVYVEDLHDSVFYTELFKRITPKNIRIARVFPQGGRTNVIARARTHDFKRKALFVIDGDLDWVRGDEPPAHAVVYRIEAYCIENLLLHESCTTQILVEEAVLSEQEARDTLDFDTWLRDISGHLVELFVLFAALNAIKPEEATVSTGLGKIITASKKGSLPELDMTKLRHLEQKTRDKIAAEIGSKKIESILKPIRIRVQSLPYTSDAISGKDYLLPLFEFHLWGYMNGKTRRSSLRIRLARHSNLNRFAGLSNALAEAARG